MKYKVGDRVIISENVNKHPCANSNGKMGKWAGKTMTIRKIHNNTSYKMVEDNYECIGEGWYWCEDMIDGLAVKEVNRKAKVGEYIKIINATMSLGYKDGDILQVTSDDYDESGKWVKCKNTCVIRTNEYVVLENYKPTEEKEMPLEFASSSRKYNLVFVQFAHEGKGYLYQSPTGVNLKYGDKVFVELRDRQQKVECISDSFEVTGTTLEELKLQLNIKGIIKNVLGFAVEKKEYDLVEF